MLDIGLSGYEIYWAGLALFLIGGAATWAFQYLRRK